MTRDEILRMAREAGWSGIYSKPIFNIKMQEDDFLRFAALVAAAEREACAQVAEQFGWSGECRHVAAAIRARGE